MQPQVLYCQNLIVYIAYKPRCIWCGPLVRAIGSHPPGAPAVPHSTAGVQPLGGTGDVWKVCNYLQRVHYGVCSSAHSWMLLVTSA